MNARRSIILGFVLAFVIIGVFLVIQAQRNAAGYADTVVQTYQVDMAATERALTTSP